MKVYLVGYMGSGKSTIGRLLAEQLKLDFIDFDRFIEQEEGKTIAHIFDSTGEDKFRELEHSYLKKILPTENAIISLGGGTPCFHNNMDLITGNGISVYLEMDVDTLVQRLSKARNKRPLIRGLNETELKLFIEANLEKRRPLYQKSAYTIQGQDRSPDEIVAAIVKLLRK